MNNPPGIVFDVGRTELQALLPDGYECDPKKDATVLFEAMNLRNLPWLNGRGMPEVCLRQLTVVASNFLVSVSGYNTFGVYANDILCHRARDGPVRGSYMLVLWESFTDPITTGREELGFP